MMNTQYAFFLTLVVFFIVNCVVYCVCVLFSEIVVLCVVFILYRVSSFLNMQASVSALMSCRLKWIYPRKLRRMLSAYTTHHISIYSGKSYNHNVAFIVLFIVVICICFYMFLYDFGISVELNFFTKCNQTRNSCCIRCSFIEALTNVVHIEEDNLLVLYLIIQLSVHIRFIAKPRTFSALLVAIWLSWQQSLLEVSR